MQKYKGSGTIELILVMILLVLFGLSTFTLVVSGNDAYSATVKEKDTLSDLRVSASYIDNKIKQNDAKNTIEIRKNPFQDQQAIVIKEVSQDSTFETWIYENEGALREAYIKSGAVLSDDMSFEICKLDHFKTEQKGGLIYIELGRLKNDKMVTTTIIVNLNSENQ